MTAKSFSMAVTVPFTTLPSKASSSERVSFISAAKSSRVGVRSFDSPIAVLILLLLHTCEPRGLAYPSARVSECPSARCIEQRLPRGHDVKVPSAGGSCANQIAAHHL